MTATVGDVVAALEAVAYPPALAAEWDAVGLVCGDPAEEVSSVLFAVDPVPETVDEVIGRHQLLVTHHPLLLRGSAPPDDCPLVGPEALASVPMSDSSLSEQAREAVLRAIIKSAPTVGNSRQASVTSPRRTPCWSETWPPSPAS